MVYYLLFVLSYALSTVSAHGNKKYQLTAGTGLVSMSVYMVINGIVSVAPPALLLLLGEESLEISLYSLLMAAATVFSAAICVIGTLKAYERGQVAVVTVFSTIGSVAISCAWGVLFLKERVSVLQVVSLVIMVAAVLLIICRRGERIDKNTLWLLLLIALTTAITAILGKQHQTEVTFDAVNTLSYSVWIGVIRAILFGVLLIFLVKKEKPRLSRPALLYGTLSSVMSGSAYVLTLVTATVLPLVITSPLGTAIAILMNTVMAWTVYREKLSVRQIMGIILCVIGIFIFSWG